MIQRLLPYIKFVISGGSAAVVNIGLLFVLTHFGGVHYLLSSVMSFCAAFFVSFLLQKFWTFKNMQKEAMHWQMAAFLLVSLINLGINTTLMYVLVEFFRVWYLAAAVISGLLLAIVSFFIYKYIIFVEGGTHHKVAAGFTRVRRNGLLLLAVVGFVLVGFLAAYQLLESPPTWLDEGIIIQTALNTSLYGPHAQLQAAPGRLVSAGYVSTSYPATYPVALSFTLFGIGLLQARLVMVLFILALALAAYLFTSKEMAPWLSLAGLFLLASFAPLYGNGKNMLGEIPGLLYLVLFLFWVKKIETKQANVLDFAVAGALLGLAVVTKPIFLLLLPPVGIVFLCSFEWFTVKKVLAALVGFAVPVWVWLTVQFNGESVGQMLAIYANPHSNSLGASVLHNALGFVTTVQPLYALLLLLTWLLSVAVRIWRKQPVSRAEYIAAGFALLVYSAYLRGAEYYRYFFLGEVLALLYLPKALEVLRPKKIPQALLAGFLVCLVAFQIYQCFGSSWVAEHYASRRTEALSTLRAIDPSQSVFVYQAPEAVVFLPTHNYYQYLNILHVAIVGEDNVAALAKGAFDFVVIPQQYEGEVDLSHYSLVKNFDSYALFTKR